MKFKYFETSLIPSKAHPKPIKSKTPRVNVEIKNPKTGKSAVLHCLLDTGSDFTLFHADIGEYLGIDVGKGKTQGIRDASGHETKFYFHDVVYSIGGHEVACFAGFASSLPIAGVLGTIGFFDKFSVMFNVSKNKITVRPC